MRTNYATRTMTVATVATMAMGLVVASHLRAADEAAPKAAVSKPAPDFTLPDLDGKTHSLSDYKGKVVVLEWINKDCPFVRKHYSVDAMQKLQRDYMAQGVVWLTICSSAPGKQGHFDIPTWKRRAEESKMTPTAVLLDTDGTVGRVYQATHTPHMYVINAEGTLVYAGAIDDDRSSDSSKVAGANNYVVAALTAVFSGEEVETPQTRAYGCTVKY